MDYVTLPRFSCENTAIWFAQVEAVFALSGITSESDKYDYIITQIPSDRIKMVEDIVLNPPPDNKYGHIKNEIIKRISIERLKGQALGTTKPSEYLLQLKNIADERVSTPTILHVWLTNLPVQVREIVSLEGSGDIDTLCTMADKVMDLVSPSTAQPHTDSMSRDQFEVLQRLDDLSKQVQSLRIMIDNDASKKMNSQKCIAPTSVSQQQPLMVNNNNETMKSVDKIKPPGFPKPTICWYHNIYGDRAGACVQPCHYNYSSPQFL